MLFDMRRLQGHEVQNPQGENIADIEKLLIDQSGQIHYAVLGTGGFLDLGERLVAVPFDALSITEEPVMNDLEGVEDDTVADADNTNADRSEADDANMAKKLATNDRADADNDRVADAETDADADVDTNTEVVDPSETQVNREQETRFVIQINATRDQLVNAPEFKEEDVKMLLSDSSSNKVTEFWNNPTAEPETQGAE